jgi:hypothetical protein
VIWIVLNDLTSSNDFWKKPSRLTSRPNMAFPFSSPILHGTNRFYSWTQQPAYGPYPLMTGSGGVATHTTASCQFIWGIATVRSPVFFEILSLRTNQVAHRRHVGSITGERQASQAPATLDGRKHRIVVISHTRSAWCVRRVRDR